MVNQVQGQNLNIDLDTTIAGRRKFDGANTLEPELTIAQNLLSIDRISNTSLGGECKTGFPCFYSFTDLCHKETRSGGKLLYSGYCLFHNMTCFNRQYLGVKMPHKNETILAPVPFEDAIVKAGFPLFSLVKTNTSVADLQGAFPSTFNNGNYNKIWSFISTLSTPYNAANKDQLSMHVLKYIVPYAQETMPILKKMQFLNNVIVEINFEKEEYERQMANNRWLWDIVTKQKYHGTNIQDVNKFEPSKEEPTVSFRISLEKFLIPDIWAILGYLTIPINADYNMVENVKILDNSFFMGLPLPITQSVFGQETALKNACLFNDYDEDIAKAISSQVKLHANYDYLYISAWYITPNASYTSHVPIPVHTATSPEWTNIAELAVQHIPLDF